ncbi:ROK family protein [Streptomyces sp. NPDC020412]|uniref:ROK family transcriptional regulator n=1 Tax=Streptomyces sp. NPDC020412 TaxID=3365073 RepID=UPI0037BCF2EB
MSAMRRSSGLGPGVGRGGGGGRGGAQEGANLPVLRGHNSALVLDLLRHAGEDGLSRLDLAERTGLTPQAVSKIVARLRADGLVVDAGRRVATGGKPRTVLRLVPDARHAVGLHLDRDELTVVLLDLYGTVTASRTAPLDLGAGAETVVETAAGEVEALLAETLSARLPTGRTCQGGSGGSCQVLGVGVGLPGPLDHAAGVTGRITGFPEWDGYALRDAFAARLTMPTVLDKDTNAAALGLPAAPGESFAYLHLGTGLGAGLVLDGAVHRGARTGAGEFGHQVVQLDGPTCACGQRGCIEALCLAAVARGDAAEAARVLGVGAANLVALLDIDRVLLGGRTVAAAPELFVREVGARARIPVALAAGGAHLIARGAGELVLAPVFGGRAG